MKKINRFLKKCNLDSLTFLGKLNSIGLALHLFTVSPATAAELSDSAVDSSSHVNTSVNAAPDKDSSYSPVDLALRSFGYVPATGSDPFTFINQTRIGYRTSSDFSLGAMVNTTWKMTTNGFQFDDPALVAVQNIYISGAMFKLSLEAQLYLSKNTGLPASALLPQTLLYKTKHWMLYSYSFLQYSWQDRHANMHLFPAVGYEITPWLYSGGFMQATIGYLNRHARYGTTFYGDFRAGPGLLVFLSPKMSIAPLFGVNLLKPGIENATFNVLVNAQIL